jgi:hypothetical protein
MNCQPGNNQQPGKVEAKILKTVKKTRGPTDTLTNVENGILPLTGLYHE